MIKINCRNLKKKKITWSNYYFLYVTPHYIIFIYFHGSCGFASSNNNNNNYPHYTRSARAMRLFGFSMLFLKKKYIKCVWNIFNLNKKCVNF